MDEPATLHLSKNLLTEQQSNENKLRNTLFISLPKENTHIRKDFRAMLMGPAKYCLVLVMTRLLYDF